MFMSTALKTPQYVQQNHKLSENDVTKSPNPNPNPKVNTKVSKYDRPYSQTKFCIAHLHYLHSLLLYFSLCTY